MRTHYYTSEFWINKSGAVWFHSACKLAGAAKPTAEQPVEYLKHRKVDCRRCLLALQKKAALTAIDNSGKFKIYKESNK